VHAASVSEPKFGEAGQRCRRTWFLRCRTLLLVLEVLLRREMNTPRKWRKRGLIPDAILIARNTLCQFDRTAAMANRASQHHVNPIKISSSQLSIPYHSHTHILRSSIHPAKSRAHSHIPSVPELRVPSLSASICIWSARPALRACKSFKLASSAFFSAIRATRTGDWVALDADWFPVLLSEVPMDGLRSGRPA